ncbi:MAG: PAS domain S-box protein, partial [Dehalococcoidia bacterium]
EEAPDAIIWADVQGTVRFWNRGAEELLGFTSDQAVGQTMDFFIPENLRERHWEGYHRVMAGGESRYGRNELLKVPALHADGTRRSVEFTLMTTEHPEFGVIAVAVLRDATEAFNEMRELRKRLAVLEAEAKA